MLQRFEFYNVFQVFSFRFYKNHIFTYDILTFESIPDFLNTISFFMKRYTVYRVQKAFIKVLSLFLCYSFPYLLLVGLTSTWLVAVL